MASLKWKISEKSENEFNNSKSEAHLISVGKVLNFWGVLRASNIRESVSCRAQLENNQLENFSGLEMDVMGTPRMFKLQFTPKRNNSVGLMHYEHTFKITKKWIKIRLPFKTAKFVIFDQVERLKNYFF